MAFVLIGGPMKSGKTLELIARVAPFGFTKKNILYVSPVKNVREQSIQSRLGINAEAQVVSSLKDVEDDFDVVGVDEVHMFDESDALIIEKWVKEGKDVFVTGLDLDYSGTMIPIVRKILEYRPDIFITKSAVCEVCHDYDARYTQILNRGEPVCSGLPHIVPEDGTYAYEARCRNCFVKDS